MIFISQENVTLIGISPLAKMFMDNVTSLDEKYDKIFNSTIYVMDNSTFNKYDKFLFNISGIINDPQPKLVNTKLDVMINIESDENIIKDAECNISNKERQNYILNCKINETLDYNLQSAISFLDTQEILLINFADFNNSIIKFEETKNSRILNRHFRINNKNELNTGSIAIIVIAIILLIGLILFVFDYFRKKNKSNLEHESSIIEIKKFDDSKNVYNY